MFVHYRTCLQMVRLHARPLIVFHKAAFIGLRQFHDDALVTVLLEGQIFQTFIADRGLPFRICDLFDEVCV
jgi:myotubularin-related protein 5/13